MPVADKIAALFGALRQEDIDAMPPAARRRFADACRHWAERAEPKREAPRSGVLAHLKDGERSQ